MMRSVSCRPLLWICLASLALPLAAQTAPEKPPRPFEVRRSLQPVYEALKKDPEFQRFQRELAARPQDAALQESYLRFLPLSPLEYFKIDRETRRFESPVPRYVHQAHARWVRLHEAEARRLYGHAKVDSLLAAWPAEPPAASGAAGGGGPASLSQAFSLGTNRNVAAADGPTEYQGEIQLAVNPSDPTEMVAAANTWSGPAACPGSPIAVFSSADGGGTWSFVCAPEASAYTALGLDTCFGEFVYGSDPALSWDDQGRAYLNHMLICASFRTGPIGMAIVTARSLDGGATWAAHGIVVDSFFDGDFEDKNFYAVDTTPSSPFYGRHYACWDRWNDQKVAWSADGGATWTEVDLPAAPFGGTDIFCEMAVAGDGTVHLAFDSLTCAGTCTNEAMFYTRSTDGGLTWTTPVLVRDFELASFTAASCPVAQDDRCINPFGAIAVDDTGGACDGHLYVTFTDFAPGGTVNGSDVWVSRSTNNGASWSAPVKVNDDGLPNRAQFHPFLHVDPANGNVVVAWQDARNHAGNDGLDFFVARSTDCGLSFGPNVQASQPSAEFNNAGISHSNHSSSANPNYNPNQTGEYLGLDALGGKAYLAWSDTRHYFPGSAAEPQKDNLGFAVVDWTGGTPTVCGNGVREGGEHCDGADLGGATCASRGFSAGTLACKSNCAFDTAGCSLTLTTTTFTSLAAEDGYLLESDETTSVGGTATANDATTSGIRAGDDRRDKQLRGLVSFDTAPLPDGAVIQSVTLRLRRGAVTGTSPFTTHGSLTASLRTGGFNGNVALEAADFQAAASVAAVCTLSVPAANGDWAECTLNAAGIAAVNKTGKTQIRLAFGLDDNDDRGDDYVGFYAGNHATAANHPQLVVVYQ